MTEVFDEKTFNMDGLFIVRINNRLEELDNATINGNQPLRYRLINTIHIDTHFKYTDEINQELKEKLKIISNNLCSESNNYTKNSIIQHNNLVLSIAEGKLDELHFDIIKLLYDNDLIYLKKKEYKTPEQEVEDDY